MIKVLIEGFLLQASLILVLGAQNLFVIETSLKKNHHFLAASTCILCDVILIFLGVLGISAFLVNIPSFNIAIGIFGVLFLAYYAILKLIEAKKGFKKRNIEKKELSSRKLVIIAALSFTLFNPHVYIDAFFLIGGYSTQFESIPEKLSFGAGASIFSILWFYLLAFFSSYFSNLLNKEPALKIISLCSSAILGYLSIKLGQDLYREIINL